MICRKANTFTVKDIFSESKQKDDDEESKLNFDIGTSDESELE